MGLNKKQREELRMKYDGKCAYCGEELKKGYLQSSGKNYQI